MHRAGRRYDMLLLSGAVTYARAAPRDLGDAIGRTVAGAGALRRSTSDWYREALATRTIRRTIDAIVDTVRDIRGAGDDRPRAERAENK